MTGSQRTVGDEMRKLREDAQHASWMLRAQIATPTPGWTARAACADWPDDLFDTPTPVDCRLNWRRAAAICAGCDVRLSCLAEAWQHEHGVKERTFGVRGGIPAHGRIVVRAPRDVDGPIEHGTYRGYNQHRYRKVPQCAACRAARSLEAQHSRPSRAHDTEDAA